MDSHSEGSKFQPVERVPTLTEQTDDVTLRFSERHSRLKKLCGEMEAALRDALPLIEGGSQTFRCLPGESDRDCFNRTKRDWIATARRLLRTPT